MLQLRLVVPSPLTDLVVARLEADPGVVHIVRGAGTSTRPAGELVVCDVAREAADRVVESLQDLGVHHDGAIVIAPIDVVVSDAAASAEASAPGAGGDALIWEEVEARARDDGELTVSFLIFMSIAATIAAIGILLDSAVLVIGAMVVGPDYGPLAAICVAIVRRRRRHGLLAAWTLLVGIVVGAVASFVATVFFRVISIAPEVYDISARELTAFISRPDGLGVAVAVLAGVVGMLSITQARSGALVGVLVSVTTIPAIGNIGAGSAYGAWQEVRGAALQLAVNVVAMVVAGAVTLAVQSRATTGQRPRRSPVPLRSSQ